MLLALASLVLACGSGGDPQPTPSPVGTGAPTATGTPELPNERLTLEASSDEASLQLEVPEGALPPGVAASEITIEALDPASVAEQFPDADILAAYRFGPDGLDFSTPLLATVEVPPGTRGTVATLTSDDRIEQVEPIDVRVRLSDGWLLFVYEIDHFSDFTFSNQKNYQPTRLELRPPEPRSVYAVGESFTVRVLVTPGAFESTQIGRVNDVTTRKRRRTLRDDEWHGEVRWQTDAPKDPEFFSVFKSVLGFDEDLSPTRNEPPLTPTEGRQRIGGASALVGEFAEHEFTCARVGDFGIYISVDVDTRTEVTTTVDNGEPMVKFEQSRSWAILETADRDIDRIAGTCVAAPTPTPSPPPTPTPSPTPPPTPLPSATAPPTPSATPTETATAVPTATPTPASLGQSVPAGSVLVFILGGVMFEVDGLSVVGAHPPYCEYEHVHGPAIRSLLPLPDGTFITRTEHLGECGYGPPSFFIVADPR